MPGEGPQQPDSAPAEPTAEALTGEQRRAEAMRRHQFKPGQSGNPAGKKKGALHISTRLIRELRRKNPDDEKGRRWIDLLVKKLMLELVKDPVRAGKILERLMDVDEGPVTQEVAVTAGGSLLDIVREAERIRGQAPPPAETEGD